MKKTLKWAANAAALLGILWVTAQLDGVARWLFMTAGTILEGSKLARLGDVVVEERRERG